MSNFKIGVIADVQYADEQNIKDRFYRNSTKKIKDALHIFNKERCVFVINLGDLIDKHLESYEAIMPHIKQSKTPVFSILGNHDYEVEDDQKMVVKAIYGLRRSYYTMSAYKWRFIFLDGNEISIHASLEGSEERAKAQKELDFLIEKGDINANCWNGAISEEQTNWLINELESAKSQNLKVVVCNHYPIYPPHTENLWRCEELMLVLEKYTCVKAYFAGHNHDGNYETKNDIHYVTFKGMVETEYLNSYATVEFTKKEIIIQGFGREDSRILKIK